jgi:hypothetical protein
MSGPQPAKKTRQRRASPVQKAHQASVLLAMDLDPSPDSTAKLPIVDFDIEAYVNFRILGFTPRQAAIQAGYKSHRDYLKFEQDPYVIEKLRGHVNQTRRDTLYTRDKVMEVIEEGIELCKLQGDGVGMVRGAQEFNKMQGFYAPESKEIKVSVEHEIRQRQIHEMDESDLLEALGREQPYIDAEFEELPDEI